MSQANVHRLIEQIQASPELQTRFHALSGTLNDFASEAVRLGRESGLPFSVADVLAAHEAARQVGRPSEAELKAVAGSEEPDVSGYGYISTGNSILCGFCGPQCGTSRTSGPVACRLPT
jgi:hypothetical protein